MNKVISFVGIVKSVLASIFSIDELNNESLSIFYDECAVKNRIPALVITSMAFFMECIMIFVYIIRPYFTKQAQFYPQYIYMYISMVCFCFCFIILLQIFKNSPTKLMKLEYLILMTFGIWSGLFSAFDIINGFSSYLFIQLMIINSLIFKVKPAKHIVINFISFIIYLVIILNSNLEIAHLFAEIINPFFMLIAACIVIILKNHNERVAYRNKNLIKEQHAQLEYYVNYDFLTKIPSRKSIIEYLDERIQANPYNIACMMIDIDNFKLYNDTYGHIMGDDCLMKLATVIYNCVVTHGGKAGRYGGEEFLVIFVDKKDDFIIQIANELVILVENENIEFITNNEHNVATISIGIFIEKETQNVDRNILLTLTDQALYRAKRAGKNRVSI